MDKYIIYELEQLEKITGYSLQHIKNDINDVYNKIEEKDKEIERLKQEKENLTNIVANKIIKDYDIDTPLKDELNKSRMKNIVLSDENNRLNNIIDKLEKYIVEEIDDAQEELNIILQGNDLNYKNECTKEFNCIKNALDMLLDKLKELKEDKPNE